MKKILSKSVLAFLFCSSLPFVGAAQSTGIFEGQKDIGPVLHKGTVTYDKNSGEYRVSGSGANIWGNTDEAHLVWRKLKGNFILQARAKFVGKGVDPHRKLGWMIRQSLEPNAASVNAAVHGDGLASLQYRKDAGAAIAESKFNTLAPDVIQLERRGNTFIMSVAKSGDLFTVQQVENSSLGDDVYVGLYVCAHNKNVVEKAVFDNVRIVVPAREGLVPYREFLGSSIEIFDVATGKRKVVYSEPASLQAPNWTLDGKALLYNKDGLIYRLDLKTKTVSTVNTGEVKNNNNDHVISFDGKMLGLSSTSPDKKYNSVVYTVPITGGIPKQITPIGPSYLHGWSPDGKWLTYTAQRGGDFDIYKIPSGGGEEVRLTTSPGLDDGPEYSPDGAYIYFNSVRSGRMQLWRMKPDGTGQTQLTNDTLNNWFPHLSPDGKSMVFLSFQNDVKPDDHPFYKHVYLRMMPVSGGEPKVVAYLYGGQGTINTPSWSPDSKKFAFVSNSDLLLE
ncbi:MAG TPA: biopolymer transporter TolR [Flavisolibacter sp.]|jgi:Tol biopolymer transport system component|nr:biopolymer transporter TolR [Flavisolibacter sp.]